MKIRNRDLKKGSGLAAIGLGLSVLFTLFLTLMAHDAVRRSAKTTFDAEVSQIEIAIRNRFKAYEQVLRGGAALFDASDEVSAEEFAVYTHRMRLPKHFPGIQGIGWSIRIPNNGVAEHERQIRDRASSQLDPERQEIYRQYSVYSVGDLQEQPFRTSIIYLEPLDKRNQKALGLDMFSERTRNRAMRIAAVTGQPALSGRVTLVQEIDADVQPGFLVYQPVYSGSPITPEERLASLLGFVYSPFRVRDLMTGILGERSESVDFEIYDGAEVNREGLLFDQDGDDVLHFDPAAYPHKFVRTVSMQIAGHSWTIFLGSSARFDAAHGNTIAGSVFAGGLMISCLLTLIIRSLANTRERALVLAQDMTQDLRASESRAQELAQELGRSNDDLQSFAHVASHDLQAPLRQITSFIDLLKMEYGEKLDEQANQYIEHASRGGKRLSQLVKDLLEYSRANGQNEKKEIISSDEALQSALENLQIQINESNAQIVFGELPEIQAHFDQIVRVFQNLIGNAIKYCESTPRVEIQAQRRERDWSFSIQDNGIGIEPRYLERIFIMFNRLHSGDKYEGTGIGLATCKKIIERNGGSIEVESCPSEGTKFTFSIPIPADQVHDSDDQKPASSRRGAPSV